MWPHSAANHGIHKIFVSCRTVLPGPGCCGDLPLKPVRTKFTHALRASSSSGRHPPLSMAGGSRPRLPLAFPRAIFLCLLGACKQVSSHAQGWHGPACASSGVRLTWTVIGVWCHARHAGRRRRMHTCTSQRVGRAPGHTVCMRGLNIRAHAYIQAQLTHRGSFGPTCQDTQQLARLLC